MVASTQQLALSFSVAIPQPPAQQPISAEERRRLRRAIDRLLLGDSFQVTDARGEPINAQRVDFYRYGEHFRIFHRSQVLVIHMTGQRQKAQWHLIRYLMEAGAQVSTLHVEGCDSACAYELASKQSKPIVLLPRRPDNRGRR